MKCKKNVLIVRAAHLFRLNEGSSCNSIKKKNRKKCEKLNGFFLRGKNGLFREIIVNMNNSNRKQNFHDHDKNVECTDCNNERELKFN